MNIKTYNTILYPLPAKRHPEEARDQTQPAKFMHFPPRQAVSGRATDSGLIAVTGIHHAHVLLGFAPTAFLKLNPSHNHSSGIAACAAARCMSS